MHKLSSARCCLPDHHITKPLPPVPCQLQIPTEDFERQSGLLIRGLISTILPSSILLSPAYMMGEPLSTAAGVVGIAVPAMHGTRLLLNDIEKIRGAPATVANLKKDLEGVFQATERLKVVEPSELESLGVAKQSLSAIKTCDEACETFRKDLQRWTKHSEDGKLSWRDRINVGFFQEENIKSLSTRLQTCKTTLILAVSTATLHSSIRQCGITTEIQKQITTSEVQIATAIKSSEIQMTEIEKRLTEVSLHNKDATGGDGDGANESGGSEVGGEVDDEKEAAREREGDNKSDGLLRQQLIESEKRDLNESRKILERLLSKTKDQSQISVTNISMSKGGQVVAGLVNTEGKYTDARIKIDNVTATTGGRGIAGVVEGLDLNSFFKR